MGHFMKFGYARVSSNTQDHAAQVEALKAAGCERIFSEKASGKSTNGRPEFAKLMKALKHGDVVTVVKLDRLAGRAATCRISCTSCALRNHERCPPLGRVTVVASQPCRKKACGVAMGLPEDLDLILPATPERNTMPWDAFPRWLTVRRMAEGYPRFCRRAARHVEVVRAFS